MIEIMLWRRLDIPGHEIARLEMLDDGWKLSGTAIFASQQGPAKLDYVVNCDAAWRTNSAQVRYGPYRRKAFCAASVMLHDWTKY